MHKFLRSIGFGAYRRKKEIAGLLNELEKTATKRRRIQIETDSNLCEIRAEVAPGMGLALVGETDEHGVFQREYYYPYLLSSDVSSNVTCSIQRHTEKETFAGLLDETRVGISLIFYLDNGFEYMERKLDHVSRKVTAVKLTGLSTEGKVLLPLYKTTKQIKKAQVAAKDRNNLLEAARRVLKEDIYSIVESSFMPSGIECDQYSVIGEIVQIEEKSNGLTHETVYDLTLNCNDMIFHVGIAQRDLMGEPMVGRRFKGQIWMQGVAAFEEGGDNE